MSICNPIFFVAELETEASKLSESVTGTVKIEVTTTISGPVLCAI